MRRPANTLSPDYFNALYDANPDPWQFASSPYERSKYASTIAALSKPRYANAFEVGCSIGVLTAEIAPRCDSLLAVDAAATPLELAKQRCAGYPAVRFDRMFVPQQWPTESFDLILLSEVVYYLCADDVAGLAAKVTASTATGAEIVLVHWTEATDYPLSGDQATELFIESVGSLGQLERSDRHTHFRLDTILRR